MELVKDFAMGLLILSPIAVFAYAAGKYPELLWVLDLLLVLMITVTVGAVIRGRM